MNRRTLLPVLAALVLVAEAPRQKSIDHDAFTRDGDIVEFDGYLVEADGPNGYRWISSLTRGDSGAGAYELVWVEHFAIAPRH